MKFTTICLALLCVVAFVVHTDGAKILVIFHMPAYSHYILGNKLVRLLTDRGHEVTYISSFKDKNPPKLCREIYLSGFADGFEKEKKEFQSNSKLRSLVVMIPFLLDIGFNFTERVLTHPAVKEVLDNPNEHFDAVIIEEFMDHALKVLGHRFNAPVIGFSTVGPTAWVNRVVGNPAPTSYAPEMMLSYNGTMNFWQRTHNAFMAWLFEVLDYFVMIPRMNSLIDKIYPGAPHVYELNDNVALVLMNSHISTNQPLPLLPNMINIGGYHVDPPKKLPEDLQKYLNGSKNGVVYFSMGSNLQSRFLPVQTREALLGAFRKLKMDVLWKWEDEDLPGKPDNVKLAQWLPQQDILAHPNVKLFITHGGLLSTIETIYHGVPVITLPGGADQKYNAANAVANGYAVLLDLYDLSEEKLTAALNEILGNPKYGENAKKRSKLMHDRLVSPKETAAYWVEYVIRHKGEKHFRSAALDLAWYQLYSLDIVAAVLLVFIVLLKVTCRLCRLCGRICTRETTLKKKKE